MRRKLIGIVDDGIRSVTEELDDRGGLVGEARQA